jgi:hypothetical protein
VVGRLRAKLRGAGRKTVTVRLNPAATRALKRAKKRRSFRAKLSARAVYSGAVAASKRRTVTVRR